MPAYLARSGLAVFAMLFAIALITEHSAAALVASMNAFELPPIREIVAAPIDAAVFAVATADFETMPRRTVAVPEQPASSAAVPVVVAALPATAVAPSAVRSDGIVLASWYGPGFYGNRTACGQLYTPEILGVANLTLPCGTRLTLSYGSRSLTVTVIDRGPYVAGRTLDLSNATKIALGCTDLCTLRMQILQ